jgi:intracellular multiplication protein IcmK
MGATVNFVDSAGNPWPISFANNFNAEASTVTQMAPHVLSVSANSPHLSGSVGVMLQGLTTPVNFVVTPAQEETDYRVDLHISGLSPEATPVTGGVRSSRPGAGDDELMGYLYGATPQGSSRLDVSMTGSAKNSARAWQSEKGRLILRTSAQIQSPGWYQRLPAIDGTAVYELPPTSVVRVSVDGVTQSLVIKGLVPAIQQGSIKTNGPKAQADAMKPTDARP